MRAVPFCTVLAKSHERFKLKSKNPPEESLADTCDDWGRRGTQFAGPFPAQEALRIHS